MHHTLRRLLAALAMITFAAPALAGVVNLVGNLGDPANTALVASDLSAARFVDDLDTANNVALYTLHVVQAGNVSFRSTGSAGGGIDPYFTLFSGTSPSSASWRASNHDHATTVGGDFELNEVLAAGDYTVAIGVYENLSFAENLGSGFLSDGFIGLGGPTYFGDGSYAFVITLPDSGTVPEPGSAGLVLSAACAALWVDRRRRTLSAKP